MKLLRSLIKSSKAKLNPSSSSSSLSSYWSFSSSFSFPSPAHHTNTAMEEFGKEEEGVQIDVPMLQLVAPLARPSPCSSRHLEWELQQAFHEFDANGDGRISAAEVQSLLLRMGDNVSKEDASLMIKEADKNGDGFVDLHEFVNLMTMVRSPPPFPPYGGNSHGRQAFKEEDHEAEDEEEQELQRAFRLFDLDGNGLISPKELHKMLWSLGDKEVSFEQCC